MKKLFFALLLSATMLSGTAYAYHDTILPTGEFDYKLFLSEFFDLIKTHHADDPDAKEMAEEAARGMMKALDPHSTYFTAEEFEEFNDSSNNRYYGIGAQVKWDKEKKAVILELLFEGSPALKAGLQNGDIIIAINGENTYEIDDLRKTVNMITGEEGTDVSLTIVRDDAKLEEDIVVTRGKVDAPVVYSQVLSDTIPYVSLSQFTGTSSNDIEKAIERSIIDIESNNKNMTGLILDFRYNPGGRLDQAINIVDLFVAEGLIVETKGRHAENDKQSHAHKDMIIPKDVPIVVLINKYSASASEIVSGGLQALDRATVMGVKSYGKGSVQTVLRLAHGAALKLTIAKYYTASGEVIHGVGITPDVVAELPEGYKKETREDVDPIMQEAIDHINGLVNN